MALYFSEYPNGSDISLENKLLRDKIINVIATYTREMEGYSYFGSNPGVSEDDYEDIAEELMTELNLWRVNEI